MDPGNALYTNLAALGESLEGGGKGGGKQRERAGASKRWERCFGVGRLFPSAGFLSLPECDSNNFLTPSRPSSREKV